MVIFSISHRIFKVKKKYFVSVKINFLKIKVLPPPGVLAFPGFLFEESAVAVG